MTGNELLAMIGSGCAVLGVLGTMAGVVFAYGRLNQSVEDAAKDEAGCRTRREQKEELIFKKLDALVEQQGEIAQSVSFIEGVICRKKERKRGPG